jgi:hypothetical protein
MRPLDVRRANFTACCGRAALDACDDKVFPFGFDEVAMRINICVLVFSSEKPLILL